MKALIITKYAPPAGFIRDVEEVLGVDKVEVVKVEGKPCDVMKAVKGAGKVAGIAVFITGIPADIVARIRAYAEKNGIPLYAGIAVAVEKAFCNAVPAERRLEVDDKCLEYYALAEGLLMVAMPEKFVKEYYGRRFPEYVRRG